ncbi:MAG: NUDIX hydrolase [Sphingomicrobium sp.]
MSQFVDRQWPDVPLRSGALPFRLDPYRRLEILLIRRKDQAMWSLPKGRLPSSNAFRETATMEAFEEAGVEGPTQDRPVGSFLHRKCNSFFLEQPLVEVIVFPLQVTRQLEVWPEFEVRERKWFEVEQAMDSVAPSHLPNLFLKLQSLIIQPALPEW